MSTDDNYGNYFLPWCMCAGAVRASSIFPILSVILLFMGGLCIAASEFYKSRHNIILSAGILFVSAGIKGNRKTGRLRDITVKVGEEMEVNIKRKQVRGGKIFVDVWRGRWKWSWPKSQRKLKTILIYWGKREGEHIKQILRKVSVRLDDFMLPLWKIIDI